MTHRVERRSGIVPRRLLGPQLGPRLGLLLGPQLAACAGALALAGCAAIGPPRTATPDPAAVTALNGMARGPCNQVVASVLAGEAIPLSAFRGANYSEIRSGPSASVSQYEVWLYPRDQDGVIVVNLDNTCRPMQIYGRGGADLQRVQAR